MTNVALIPDDGLDFQFMKDPFCFVKATPRQSKMQRMLLCAMNNSRFAICRQTHRLRSVEFGILKRREAKQSISKGRWQVLSSNINLVCEDQLEALRQRLKDRGLITARGWRCPGAIILLVRRRHRNSKNSSLVFGLANQSLDLHPADLPHRCQKRPLVLKRLKLLVEKNGITQ